MILGIPVQDGHELTAKLLKNLFAVSTADLKIVIYDNGSEIPYTDGITFHPAIEEARQHNPQGIQFDIIRNTKNIGYYAPLKAIAAMYADEPLVGLIHNDMLIYEQGWNERMAACFADDPSLMLVGLVGSNEVDSLGGRGGGTVCFFRGEPGYQDQSAGGRVHGLVPAACLDSLFMMFRREGIEKLNEDWDNLTLAHFYDRIWPLRLVEQGYHVATMGIECDHMGGQTTVANPRYYADCKTWLEERNLPYENPETEMYLVAERRYLSEYREGKQFIPCRINGDYSYERTPN